MNGETFHKQSAFAGPKKPSMLRRAIWNDYHGRQIYMLTLVTEARRQLFGRVTGTSTAPKMELSELGKAVEEEFLNCEKYHPEISVLAIQMMPDHLHGIIFIRERMEKPLGMVIRGFKQSCNKHYRRLILGVPYVALSTQRTRRRGEERSHGMLFARGYNDRILLREAQLKRWIHYLKDNPRRLLIKREQPDLFRVQHNLKAAGMTFSAIGNAFLLDRPVRLQVQCSRKLTEKEIEAEKTRLLSEAREGAVLVSPAISPGEKTVMRAAFEEGLPLIFLQENGFTDLAKPGGKRIEACAEGRLLILAPWHHHNENITITRNQCRMLNYMACAICK